MNQDFTVKKKQYLSEKKIRAEGFTWKKNAAEAESEKKNSCKLKIAIPPPPPITFLMVRPLLIYFVIVVFGDHVYCSEVHIVHHVTLGTRKTGGNLSISPVRQIRDLLF